MGEKLLIQSQQYNTKKGILITILAFIAFAICFGSYFSYNENFDDYNYLKWGDHRCNPYSLRSQDHWYSCPAYNNKGECLLLTYSSASSYALENINVLSFMDHDVFGPVFIGCLPIIVLVFLWLGSYTLTVTDKRIYGRTAWGKRVDLPLDSVSAVATSSLKGLAIATSSGRICFKLIKNRDEIHHVISALLIERQSKPVATTTIKQEIPQSNADELKKFKELLDSGVITQEEFDAKKKQLLGL